MSLIRGAVLGSPVSHSLSPLLHREAFTYLGLSGSYDREEVGVDDLLPFFTENSGEYTYLSLTMPLKEQALLLPVIVDPLSTRIQSSNTLYRRDDVWHLTSTDGSGFISALKAAGHENFERVLILGAGGTARAVVGALDGRAQEIVVLGRTSTRRDVLESSISTSKFDYQRWNDSPPFADYDLVVNTTPAGAADLLADAIRVDQCRLFFDVIYKPWPTVLASRWLDAGGTVINGLELLLYQGIHQLALALNRDIDEVDLAQHLRPVLLEAMR